MKKVTFKGKNIEEATKGALEVLGLGEDKVNVKVLKEGKPGMLGMIGGEEAEVEVSEKMEVADLARQMLQEILDRMGMLAIAEISEDSEEGVVVNIKGEDMGRIIGKEGAMLKSLQTLLSIMVARGTGSKQHVSVDAGGYREKHSSALNRLARDAANDVVQTGQEKVLPPMNAHDRRIIHMALKDNSKVETHSRGDGRDRRLVIGPK
ncbi:MAG: RNA-binding cell elongation regulator Jag/EloR [Candidatus Margulisiibacteriota bacterium]|nr:protein jag [Candidatus Margulisiibacteriota bacterium]